MCSSNGFILSGKPDVLALPSNVDENKKGGKLMVFVDNNDVLFKSPDVPALPLGLSAVPEETSKDDKSLDDKQT